MTVGRVSKSSRNIPPTPPHHHHHLHLYLQSPATLIPLPLPHAQRGSCRCITQSSEVEEWSFFVGGALKSIDALQQAQPLCSRTTTTPDDLLGVCVWVHSLVHSACIPLPCLYTSDCFQFNICTSSNQQFTHTHSTGTGTLKESQGTLVLWRQQQGRAAAPSLY